jgi:hypothetical protein
MNDEITTDDQIKIKNGEEEWKSYLRRGILLVMAVAVSVLILFLSFFVIFMMCTDEAFRRQVAETIVNGLPGIAAALILIFGFKQYSR